MGILILFQCPHFRRRKKCQFARHFKSPKEGARAMNPNDADFLISENGQQHSALDPLKWKFVNPVFLTSRRFLWLFLREMLLLFSATELKSTHDNLLKFSDKFEEFMKTRLCPATLCYKPTASNQQSTIDSNLRNLLTGMSLNFLLHSRPHARLTPGNAIKSLEEICSSILASRTLNFREVFFFVPAAWQKNTMKRAPLSRLFSAWTKATKLFSHNPVPQSAN